MSQGVRKGSILSLIGYSVAGVFLALFHAFAGRLLGVEDYGLLNTLLSYINLATALVGFGAMECLTRYLSFYEAKGDNEKEAETIKTSLFIYLILIASIFIVTFIIRDPILRYHFNNNSVILYQFLIGTVFLSLFRFQNGLLKGYRKFDIFSAGNGIQALMMFLFLFIFVKSFGVNVSGAGWSIAASALVAVIFYQIPLKNVFSKIKRAKTSINRDIIKFIISVTLISLMNIWLLRAGPILLKTLGNTEGDKLAGLFSAAIMPLNFARVIVLSLQAGFYPNLSRAYSIKDNNLIKRYISKSFGIIIGIILLVILGYYFFGTRIILLIYKKEEFLVSRTNITLLALAYSFYFLGLHFTKILMARNTPMHASVASAIGIVGMFAALILFKFPPMRLVIVSILTCNLIYFFTQALSLLILKTKKTAKPK